ncbi:hypothetical protein HHI36_001589 [Cryptolaemus montrouzieri]|uniref:Uncharacterized protein n=1 Tax=Cryptolaemus montrouzieri TaxID=559131 RepID=A0ABD2P8R8_9CUCU
MDLEDIIFLIDELYFSTLEEQDQKLRVFYKNFARLKLSQEHQHGFLKIVMPKIHSLLTKSVIRKDLLLLSLLSEQNFNILELFLEYEKGCFELNLQQPSSLYDFCIFKKEHWILEIIRNFNQIDEGVFGSNICNKLIVLKSLDLTINEFNPKLLEDIFAIIFLTERHIDESNPDIFKNNEVIVRSILHLIKGVFDSLKLKNLYVKGTEDYERFIKLSKFIHDAFWRLELVTHIKKNPDVSTPKMLCYMLAPPMSLLAMCLRHGDFTRAHQVVEIFDLQDTELAKELLFTEKLRDLRNHCKRFCKIQLMKKLSPSISVQGNDDNLIKTILDLPSVKIQREFEDIVENSTDKNYLCHYKSENEKFMNLMDLLCTQSSNEEMSTIF